MFPSKESLTICLAHAAYRMQDRFDLRKTGIKSFEVRNYDDLTKRIGEADVVLASGMWKNDLIPHAGKLKFIQSISSGMDQYSKELLGAKQRWPQLAATLGGYWGAHWSRLLPVQWLRRGVIAIGLAMTVAFFLKNQS